jgi:cytochrome c553
MSDADVRALVAYLRTLAAGAAARTARPTCRCRSRASRIAPGGCSSRHAFTPPAETPTEPLARGRYLVEHVAICGDCHTQRDRFGAFDMSLYLAGTDDGPDGKPVPNITPDADTGIPKWREGHFVELLQSGMLPDMDNVQG